MPLKFLLHRFLLVITLQLFASMAMAGEGMWLVNSLSPAVMAQLRSAGLTLPPDSLYQSALPSLKDAVVQFGGGCTGEVVSSKGLVLTNHHCGYGQIQSLSTLEKNFLDSGFWAGSLEEELPCPGLTVTFIREVRDVSGQVLSALPDTMPEDVREKRIRIVSDSLAATARAETGLNAFVRSFFQGNAYYLYITEVFRDIRLVGTPPECIGNFGGETDNWMWPRHTGDFAVFRIYAGKDNRPAAFDSANVPYSSRRWFPIQASGVKEGDFTMVMGFPGKTNLYLPYSALSNVFEQSNPDKIAIRKARLSVWDEWIAVNDTVRLKYAAKNRRLANHFKKWKGELDGMRKNGTLSRIRREEQLFRQWLDQGKNHPPAYRQCLDELNLAYGALRPLSKASDYFTEAIFGVELFSAAQSLLPLLRAAELDSTPEAQQRIAKRVAQSLESFYKDYDRRVDRIVAGSLLPLAFHSLPLHLQPPVFGDGYWLAEPGLDSLYANTILSHPDSMIRLMKNWSVGYASTISKDPAIGLARSIATFQAESIDAPIAELQRRINKWQRVYMAARMEQAEAGSICPDANGTLRLAYGNIQGLQPQDGVDYHWQTTLKGVLEKSSAGEEDYRISTRLRSLGEQDAGFPVAFIASNHTTGGNSGSPVLNARGELIGINFDRIWEGVMSDYDYAPALSRNISVDIQYVLFIIEKYGQAQRLLNEMEIRYNQPRKGKQAR